MGNLGVTTLPAEATSVPTPPKTYSIIFDNLDFFCRTHHQSISQKNQSTHWIHHMRRDYVVLGSRIITKYMDAFKPLSSTVVHNIPHQYSAEMSEPSTHYPLGLLFKDENQSTDLADVLQHFQNEYVPKGPEGPQSILVGGDRLTEG
uniref:Uncharacterized protein n=1 Tax=Knipowitschia caucasica TaxID=637954 RepID=A0AAV2K6F8_KNICA